MVTSPPLECVKPISAACTSLHQCTKKQFSVLRFFRFLTVCRGLEQQVALPRDSYLQDYFTDLYGVLRVGPPLYFVVPNIHMDPQDPDINMICSVGGCNDTSFVNEVSDTMLACTPCTQCLQYGHDHAAVGR